MFLGNLAYTQEDDDGEDPVQARPAEFLNTKILKVSTVQSVAIMPDTKYEQWEDLKDEFLNLSPYFNRNQEWKSNQQSIKDLLNGVDAIFLKLRDSQKDVLTVEVGMGRNISQTLMRYEELIKSHKSNLESMGGISEETGLKLQIAMERRSKIIQTLSNILKKISQTSDAITNNLK